MDMIKFPVRFDSTGFVKLRDGSEDYYAQLLTIAVQTEPRTHPFSPFFGVLDPAFRGIDRGVFIFNAARFVPEVTITNIDSSLDPTMESIKISFSFRIKSEAI
jgi:hypothetical protein